jgi:hypothetical protein
MHRIGLIGALISLTTIPLIGCVKRTPASVLAPNSEASRQNIPETTQEVFHGVEILWKIPSEEVDGFVLVYGYKPDKLNNRLVVKTQDIRIIDHPEWGKVYQYLLRPVEPEKKLYFTLESFRGDQISPPSSVEAVPTRPLRNSLEELPGRAL